MSDHYRILTHRNIGKRYHNLSLTSHEHEVAKDIREYIEDGTVSQQIALGNGAVFFGETQDGYDLTLLFARALILSGFQKLHCYDFYDLLDYEELGVLWQEKHPVVIMNFNPDSASVAPDAYRRLENLLNYYLDNSIPFYLHIPVSKDKPTIEYGNLFSPVFLDRVLKNMTQFSVE